jgi:hypothetical protein
MYYIVDAVLDMIRRVETQRMRKCFLVLQEIRMNTVSMKTETRSNSLLVARVKSKE